MSIEPRTVRPGVQLTGREWPGSPGLREHLVDWRPPLNRSKIITLHVWAVEGDLDRQIRLAIEAFRDHQGGGW